MSDIVYKAALLALLLLAPAVPSAARTTKISLPKIANLFRAGGSMFQLGGEPYRATILPDAGGGWTYFLVGPEGSYAAPDAVIPTDAVAESRTISFEGYAYQVSYGLPKLYDKKKPLPDLYQMGFLPKDTPHPSPGYYLSVGAVKINTWKAAEPVPVLGKRWRVLYRMDTKEGGPRVEQLYLVERKPERVVFHPISMTILEEEGVVKGIFGGKNISIRLHPEGLLRIVDLR